MQAPKATIILSFEQDFYLVDYDFTAAGFYDNFVDALDKIKREAAKEGIEVFNHDVLVRIDNRYDEGCCAKYFVFSFNRETPNPNYEQEMIEYQAYLRENERRKNENKLKGEARNAKKEYKEARRLQRIANRTTKDILNSENLSDSEKVEQLKKLM